MAENQKDASLSISNMVASIENELAMNTLFGTNKDTQDALKASVSHIILKAIAVSKDPRANKETILALYETAREIITNSHLRENDDYINRLQDLINAIIDGDDIAAQIRLYNNNNKKFWDSKIDYIDAKLNALSTEAFDTKQILSRMESKVGYKAQRNSPSLPLILITGFFAMLFTIITSVVIISTILTNAINNEGASIEQRRQMQLEFNRQAPAIQKDSQ